jgi:integrase
MSSRDPKYRLHKPTGQAVVTIAGRDIYLGKHGTPESKAKYHRLLAERAASIAAVPAAEVESASVAPRDLSIAEMLAAYFDHAARYYRDAAGRATEELKNMRDAVRELSSFYGEASARDFGPLKLQAVREHMIRSGLSRRVINARVHRIRRVFRWAVSQEMIPGSVVVNLDAVEALRAGRTEAPERPPVAPVPVETVEATLPYLPGPVAAMVRLQLLTGCRPGEIASMRGCDLIPGEPTWEFRPAHHKGAWRGKTRVIPLGPRAVEIIKPFLSTDTTAPLFPPANAVAAMRKRRGEARMSVTVWEGTTFSASWAPD